MESPATYMLEELQSCNHRLNIEFKGLSYTVSRGRGKKAIHHTILKEVSGTFHAGRLTAILGASGAGKSTLLNVLSGHKSNGVTGSILINGQARGVSQFKKLSCYVPQDFAMLTFLTTQETLAIAADLKLGTSVAKTKKKAMVNEILHLLGLHKVKDAWVGKLSGGEQKRLSIGVELLTNPPVMFVDEPTSGLDSSSSLQMISHMKSLAQSGRTIVCTIHQPSSRLFEMFDDVYILCEGQCLYNGPLKDMILVFEEEGFSCPNYYNRADFAIEVACKERGNDTSKLVTRFKRGYLKPAITEIEEKSLKETNLYQMQKTRDNILEISTNDNIDISVSTLYQFIILTKRGMLSTYRDLYLGLVRFFTHLIVGLLLGAMCYNIGNEASKAQSNAACIFFFILFLFVLSPLLTVLSYPLEANVFQREYQNNWYSLPAYFLSKLISDLPLQVLCPTVFLAAGYFLTGQPIDNMRPIKFWALCVLLSMCGQSMGFVAGAAFDAQMGLFMVIAWNIPMILFSGFYVRLEDIADYLGWLTRISHYRYGFEGSLAVIYSNRPKMDCSVAYCHYKDPVKLLEDFGMEKAIYEEDMLAILFWTVLYQAVFFFVLKLKMYISK